MRVHPFAALRPAAGAAPVIASPPYDVVTRREAAELAAGNPLSFLRVIRAEIDLAESVDAYDRRVYETARSNLARLVTQGVLVREAAPSLYCYRETMAGRDQIGVVACVSVEDYETGVIRKHETTRPDKEDDRTRHILDVGAHAEPVLLAYRDRPELDDLVRSASSDTALCDFATADGVRHTVWRVAAAAPIVDAFRRVPCAYVADGHHRSASAARAAAELRAAVSFGRDAAEASWFPAVLVPRSRLAILPYNRLVRDLGGQSPDAVLGRLRGVGRVAPASDPRPCRPGSFCIYLDRRWWLLELPEDSIDRRDPIASLDVALLQDRVLGPILGIADQRTDERLDFVGGIRGPRELEARADAGEAALAVSMFPTSMDQLMAVADAGRVMPPKSTWFEPKLLSGLFVHTL
jgi:uncharacterized protein (DUF1015 family)